MQNNNANDHFGQSVDEKLFRLLIANVKDYAIFMIDPDGYILTWNQGAAHIKGYRESEIIGKHISVFYTMEDRAANEPLYNLSEALEHGTFESEGWRVRKNGSQFWANIVFTALYDNNGGHIGFAKITRDITERKLMEDQRAALQTELEKKVRVQTGKIVANELRFRKLIEHSYDGIVLLDDKLNIFYLSLSAERINGVSDVKSAEQAMIDLVHPDDKQAFGELLSQTLGQPGRPLILTFRCLHRNGAYIWLEGMFTNLLGDEYIRAIVCNFRDITERKLHEEELNRQNSVLKEIAWVSSHEVRRPVASIIALVSLMDMATDIKEKEEILDKMNLCVKDLDEMVRHINNRISKELST
ncbi:MAG TPA: PAS domain S-box protein [Mucilaginibacter sp.]|nr:PAS domain S-box protein [Mucilaginibacter sp.]